MLLSLTICSLTLIVEKKELHLARSITLRYIVVLYLNNSRIDYYLCSTYHMYHKEIEIKDMKDTEMSYLDVS